MKKAKKVLYLYIYIYILYIVAIYTHARGAAPTPLRHAEPFRLVVPSCLLFPLPFIPSPVPRSFVVVCCALDAATPRRSLSVDHQARPPPFVLPSVKFSFRRARCSGYFVPFCRPLSCLPYSLHAAVSARRHTQRKRAYLRSCAPRLLSSAPTFYTLKKSFTFYKKKLAKILARFKKTCYLCTRKMGTKKHLTRSLNLLYIYILYAVK